MIRLAIVGCGAHAEAQHAVPLARYVKAQPDVVSLVAACDVVRERAERFCDRFGFAKAYTDLDALMQDAAPDAVVSVVPPGAVAKVGKTLLERGVVCSIEKPPGISRVEATDLLGAAARTGTPHMVSVNRRFAPHLNQALEWAREQGEVAFLRGAMFRSGRSEPDFIVGTGLHTVDAMRHLGGDVTQASIDRRNVGGSDWFALRLVYASGAVGEVEIFPTAGFNAERYELYGDDFAAHVTIPTGNDVEQGSIRCWRGRKLVIDERFAPDTPVDVANGAWAETKAWVESVRAGDGFRPTLADVYGSLEICFDCIDHPRAR